MFDSWRRGLFSPFPQFKPVPPTPFVQALHSNFGKVFTRSLHPWFQTMLVVPNPLTEADLDFDGRSSPPTLLKVPLRLWKPWPVLWMRWGGLSPQRIDVTVPYRRVMFFRARSPSLFFARDTGRICD